MKRTLLAVAALVGALLLVEQGLERSREKQEEDRYTRIADLRATRILPQYLSSLFMGSFRAVAVDALWVQLSRMRREEHRFFEAVEIMDMISTLQPRNPEVWAYQGWDSMYNIALNVSNPDEQWRWTRYGLRKFREGIRHLPDDPYLKRELAFRLVHRATIREGLFQQDLMTRVEEDEELQRELSLQPPGDRPLTVFQLAIPWLEEALKDLQRIKSEREWRYISLTVNPGEERDYWTTQSGLNIHPSTVDGDLCRAMYFQAFYLRRHGRPSEAAEWFRDAAKHSRLIRERYRMSTIFDDFAVLCDGLAEACGMPATIRDERLRLLDFLTRLQKAAGTKDFQYLHQELSELKRGLGGDEHEYNDDLDHAVPLPFEEQVEATIAPPGDVDMYLGYVRGPDPEAREAFRPHRVGFLVKKDGDAALKLTLWTFKDGRLQPTVTRELRENRWEEIEGITDTPGIFALAVEAADAAARPEKPAYRLQWSLAKPAR